MNAICGLLWLDGRAAGPPEIDAMTDALAHRGPDGRASASDGPVSLGHLAAWTTPESRYECQPLRSNGVFLVADIRLDNREELLSVLGVEPPHDVIGDAHLVLRAYLKWGAAFCDHIFGDFTIAIWDSRSRQLTVVRDHTGVKPLYYHHSPGRLFCFATEIKALLTVPGVPSALNETMVGRYACRLLDNDPETLFAGILRLTEGRAMTVGDGSVRVRNFAALDPHRELRLKSDGEYAEAMREHFERAVRVRMRSVKAVGATLSGGLDSSSIACVARDLLRSRSGTPLHTFSLVFPSYSGKSQRRIDERVYQDAVIDGGGIVPHRIAADTLSPATELDRMQWHTDQAVWAPNLYLHWAMYRRAQENGVGVMLDGFDGDTTISHGYQRIAELVFRGHVHKAWRETQVLVSRAQTRFNPWRVFVSYSGVRDFIPNALYELKNRIRGRRVQPWPEFVRDGFARRIRLREQYLRVARSRKLRHWNGRFLHIHPFETGLLSYGLELANQAAAAFGVDTRFPFCDRRLIEFCVSLPMDQKLRHGWPRFVFRQAMSGILPESIQWRFTKADLSVNFDSRLLMEDRVLLDAELGGGQPLYDQYFDYRPLQSAYERAKTMGTSDGMPVDLFATAGLTHWMRAHGFAPH